MRSSNTKHKQQGVEILVRGTVQGVGFRPFIYNLASRLGVSGTVTNTGDGVVITATAPSERLDLFIASIKNEAPPLARITSVASLPLDSHVTEGFFILPSVAGPSANTAIPPDIAICDDCLREFLDPGDDRFHYPFINCTNCGPRFTIVETIPYDRPGTSMKVFPMCQRCAREYHDPGNRRFHAQPNACRDCGPVVSLHDRSGKALAMAAPVAEAATQLSEGKVLAMRGLGGFHLVVDGSSDTAVALLRARKGRPDKPLAVMIRDLEAVNEFCRLNPTEQKILTSPERPIVLLNKKDGSGLAANLAPGIEEIGVMLPYTPLHHLLFQMPGCPKVLVMTSGNVSGSPICTANDDALAKLYAIADYFLLHNREIVTRVDDSVIKIAGDNTLLLRRARGFVPAPVMIDWPLPKILGCGAGLKSTFSLGREKCVFTSQHIGDLDSLPAYEFYLESVDHLKRVLQLEPEAVSCDLHPDYLSSRFAAELDLPLYKIQHHHAHAVAVMAEHGLPGPVLAVILDGTGLGEDGTIWGGEILRAELTGFTRLGHLSHLLLPGGDAANTEPWRMGISALYQTFGPESLRPDRLPSPLAQLDQAKIATLSSMMQGGFLSPPSSSCGRLFDAVASLLGLRQKISYEGQAAMELEALAKKARTSSWLAQLLPKSHTDLSPFLHETNGKWEISSPEFVKMVRDGMARAESKEIIALRFHSLLISSITGLIENLAHQTGIRHVVLSGGCMQNSLLLEGLFHTLEQIRLQVFTGNMLPVNDGAVSFGQTIIGGLRHVSRHPHESHQRPG